MAYDAATNTFNVGTADELNAAVANLDAIGKAGNNNGLSFGAYTIRLTANITLGGTAGGTYAAVGGVTPLTIDGTTVAGSNQLYALNLTTGANAASSVSVTIDGGNGTSPNFTLSGANTYNGFFVYNGRVAIQNLGINNALAQGGAGGGGGGGGGAGLGGGLFVAGTGNTTGSGAALVTGGNVTLTNVSFSGNTAQGGSSNATIYVGGGGLNGGRGGTNGNGGGGGIGLNASGGDAGGGAGGVGIVLGADGGGNGGTYNSTPGGAGGNFGGGGGGGLGRAGGSGGVGGGDGGRSNGAPAGFGGGGGYSPIGVDPGINGPSPGGFGGGGGTQSSGGFGGGGGVGFSGSGAGGFGAGTAGTRGGGGLGAGGDIFVQSGGLLTIQGTLSLSGGSVVGGTSGGGGGNGRQFASGIYFQGANAAGALTFAPGANQLQSISDVIGDDTGSALAAGYTGPSTYIKGSVGLTLDGDATGNLTLSGANTYTGGTTLTTGTLTLSATTTLSGGTTGTITSGAAGQGGINFGTGAGTLRVETAALSGSGSARSLAYALTGFGTDGDVINLRDLSSTGASASYSNGVLTVSNGTTSDALTVNAAPTGYSYGVSRDGSGGTNVRLVNSYAIGNAASVTEGGTLAYTITRTGDTSAAANITFGLIIGGTATSGSDYTAPTGTVSFAANSSTGTLRVATTDDRLVEGPETVALTLNGTSDGGTVSGTGTGTTNDNDTATLSVGNSTVTEGGTASVPVSLNITTMGSGTIGLANDITVTATTADGTARSTNVGPGTPDYTATTGIVTFQARNYVNGEAPGPYTVITGGSFSVNTTNDAVSEPTEQFTVNLSNASANATIGTTPGTVTINDNDTVPTISVSNASVTEGNSGTANLAFTVSLGAASGVTTTVNYTTAGGAGPGAATEGSDYIATNGSLIFAPGTTQQTVNVTIDGDTLYEGSETFSLNLSGATNTANTIASGTGTILDDDAAPTLALSPATLSLSEGNTGSTAYTYTVTRTGDAQAAQTDGYAVTGGGVTGTGAADAADFTGNALPSGTVSFAQGVTSQTITVLVAGDTSYENTESFTLTLGQPNFGSVTQGSATGTIVNYDAAPPSPPAPTGPTGPTSGDNDLVGIAGPDTISLLAGNDTYVGGAGADLVYGNQGADLIYGNQDNDTLYGGQGDDRAYGGMGDDVPYGNLGDDVLYGNQGADIVYGNQGADIVYGNQGNDVLYGGQGDDVLYGGMGDDVLYGGMGDDTLVGGVGANVLVGGLGADRYVFSANGARYLVVGFNQGEGDRLSLGGQTYTTTTAADGNALLTLSGGGTIEMAGSILERVMNI